MPGRHPSARLYAAPRVPLIVQLVADGLRQQTTRELCIAPRSRSPAHCLKPNAEEASEAVHLNTLHSPLTRTACAYLGAAIAASESLEHLTLDVRSLPTSAMGSLLTPWVASSTPSEPRVRRLTLTGGLTILEARALVDALAGVNHSLPSSPAPTPPIVRRGRRPPPRDGPSGPPTVVPTPLLGWVTQAEGGLAWQVVGGATRPGQVLPPPPPRRSQRHGPQVSPVLTAAAPLRSPATRTGGVRLELVLRPWYLDEATARVLVGGVRRAPCVVQARVCLAAYDGAARTTATASVRRSRLVAAALHVQLAEACAGRGPAPAAAVDGMSDPWPPRVQHRVGPGSPPPSSPFPPTGAPARSERACLTGEPHHEPPSCVPDPPSPRTPSPLVDRRRFLAQPGFDRRCTRPRSVEPASARPPSPPRRYAPPRWRRPLLPEVVPPSPAGRVLGRQPLVGKVPSPPGRVCSRSTSATTLWARDDSDTGTPSPPPRRPATPVWVRGRQAAPPSTAKVRLWRGEPALHTPPPCVSPRYVRRVVGGPTTPPQPIPPYVRPRTQAEGLLSGRLLRNVPVPPCLLSQRSCRSPPPSRSKGVRDTRPKQPPRLLRPRQGGPQAPPPPSSPRRAVAAAAVVVPYNSCSASDSCFVCGAGEQVSALGPSSPSPRLTRAGADDHSIGGGGGVGEGGRCRSSRVDLSATVRPNHSAAPRTVIYSSVTGRAAEGGEGSRRGGGPPPLTIDEIIAAAARSARELKRRAHPLLPTPPSSPSLAAVGCAEHRAEAPTDTATATALVSPQHRSRTTGSGQGAAMVSPTRPPVPPPARVVRVGEEPSCRTDSTSGCSAKSLLNASGSTAVREYLSLEPTPRLRGESAPSRAVGEGLPEHGLYSAGYCLPECQARPGAGGDGQAGDCRVVPVTALRALVASVEGLRQDLVLYSERVDVETQAMVMRIGAASRAFTAQSATHLVGVRAAMEALALGPQPPQR